MSETIQVYEGADVFEKHQEVWEALLASSDIPADVTPFYCRPQWMQCWAKQFGHQWRCLLLIVERDGKAIGLLPLALGRGRLGNWKPTMVTWASWPWMDVFEIPAVNHEDREATFRLGLQWILNNLSGYRVMLFRELPTGGSTIRALRAVAKEQKIPMHHMICADSPILDLQEFHRREQPRKGSDQRKLRSKRKKLDGLGEAEFKFFRPTPEEVDSLIAECADVEKESWQCAFGVGFLQGEEPLQFSTSLWKEYSPSADLALATLRLDGRLIAYHWGPCEGNRFLSLNMSYRQEFKNTGPGNLLNNHMVDEGENLGLQFLDASRGTPDGKHFLHDFGCTTRNHAMVVLYPPSLKGKLFFLLRHHFIPTARKILYKPSPWKVLHG